MNDNLTQDQIDAIILDNWGRKSKTEIGVLVGMSRDAVGRRYAKIAHRVGAGGAPALPPPPPPPMDPTHPDILDRDRQISVLRERLRNTNKQLEALHRRDTMVKQLADVVRESAQPLPPAPQVMYYEGELAPKRHAVDFVALLSDQHADEVVNRSSVWGLEEFNFDIFRARLGRYRDLIRDYAVKHLPRYKPEKLWVFHLGDSVHGDIHDNGPRNHFRNTIKAALAVGDAQAQMIQSLVPCFEQIVVVCVSGNHPRRSKGKVYESPHDNFDYLVATQMATRLASEPTVSVIAPDSWTAFVEVRGRVWALNHGDEVTSYTGLPWVGFDRRSNRLQTLAASADVKIDYFAYGHYHTQALFTSAGGVSFHNGAFPAMDPYSIERVSVGRPPMQWLFVQDDERGVIMQLPILIRDESVEEMVRCGVYEPELGRRLTIDEITPAPDGGFELITAPELADAGPGSSR